MFYLVGWAVCISRKPILAGSINKILRDTKYSDGLLSVLAIAAINLMCQHGGIQTGIPEQLCSHVERE
jgi:hypothetical protein